MLNVDIFKEQVGCNVAANEAQIRICNLKLKQNNLPEIPQEYAEVLKMCNGFSNEDVFVFGAEIKNNNWYKDLAEFNIAYFRGNKVTWLILGEDDFSFFIYDAKQKKYYIAGRDDLEEEFSDSDFLTSLEYILKIE